MLRSAVQSRFGAALKQKFRWLCIFRHDTYVDGMESVFPQCAMSLWKRYASLIMQVRISVFPYI